MSICMNDIPKAFKSIKNGISVIPNGILVEALKEDETIAKILYPFIQKICNKCRNYREVLLF